MSKPIFTWTDSQDAVLKRTPLFDEHRRLGAKLIPFAGWEMPVWYSSVGEEHRAVRETAGLFDVAHMGTLEVAGPRAAEFLDLVGTNRVSDIKPGGSRYSTMLDINGQILDDMWVYRPAAERFFVVVNAANWEKDWAWLNAVNQNRVVIDAERPDWGWETPVTLRDLKNPASGDDQRVDLALQGPRSLDILLACDDDPSVQSALRALKRTQLVETRFAGMDMLIARTGYTGEPLGFELYVHPDRAVALWQLLLEKGRPFGLKPCGLAARDSTRIEAGLPLYGHDLAGPLHITPTEAGFDRYVKYDKPFFIGKGPYMAYHQTSQRQMVRFQVEKGARPLRGGEHGEPVVSPRGRVIGTVTSCAQIGEVQVGLALVESRYAGPDGELLIYPEAKRAVRKLPHEFEWGDTVALPVRAVILPRFPG